MSAAPHDASHWRQMIAELCWDRYMSATKVEGEDRRSAFIDTIVTMLEEQDRAWSNPQ